MSSSDKDKQQEGPSKAEEQKEAKKNAFKNDGSFLEMFKKMQEEAAKKEQKPEDSKSPNIPASSSSSSVSLLDDAEKPPPVSVGKRRGGRVLPTGQVKKQKNEGEEGQGNAPSKDAWSAYMAEVKKYQSSTCEEEGKNRPLVK
ncbi:telomerase RNA component interacting RNase [Neocloeon triangulifer]|uniref:telomerase RNA component interacting RNase n=1 Tax=Neocloeon triangulifer TaxID=2078957 RepID=UPI00286F64E8|nr:telomerase RNA component interacting RNase [Neocloeon triangulifer]